MTDQYREPIEDTVDVDLREKFLGGGKQRPVRDVMENANSARDHSVPESTASESPNESNESDSEKYVVEDDRTYSTILQKVRGGIQASNAQAHTIAADAKRVIAQADIETQVQHLIVLASEKGPVHAIKVAQHLRDYYILDKMHDQMLSEQFHQQLSEKGFLG